MSILRALNGGPNYGWFCLPAAIFGLSLLGPTRPPESQRQNPSERTVGQSAPLAYVRTLEILPIVLETAPERPLPPLPPRSDKKSKASRAFVERRRTELGELKRLAAQQLGEALTARLAGVRGLNVVKAGDPTPPDARLRVAIDRVGAHIGASREIWFRAAGRLEVAESRLSFGPYYAVGQAVSPKWLIKPGFVWPDNELMAEAARQAARQLTQSLRTGTEPYFVRAGRAAVLPAAIDSTARKVIEGQHGETTLTTRGIGRLADVLFQPGLTPMVDRAGADEVERAMLAAQLNPGDFWDVLGAPAGNVAVVVGRALKAEFLFISRAAEMSITRRPALIQQFGSTHEGTEVQAEMAVSGAFIRGRDAAVLWSDTVIGSSTARTQFTRHGPRLRREDQCLADAARVGYARLRSSFENFKRQFE